MARQPNLITQSSFRGSYLKIENGTTLANEVRAGIAAPVRNRTQGTVESLTQDQLPAAVKTCLTTNHAGYTFEKAFAYQEGTNVKGYGVLFTRNGKRYAAELMPPGPSCGCAASSCKALG